MALLHYFALFCTILFSSIFLHLIIFFPFLGFLALAFHLLSIFVTLCHCLEFLAFLEHFLCNCMHFLTSFGQWEAYNNFHEERTFFFFFYYTDIGDTRPLGWFSENISRKKKLKCLVGVVLYISKLICQ